MILYQLFIKQIKFIQGISYHPQSQGSVEAFNKIYTEYSY